MSHVLDQILSHAAQLTEGGELPVALFDIDSTLVSTGERHRRILVEVAHRLGDDALIAVAEAATAQSFRWSVDEPVIAAGLGTPERLRALKRGWGKRFFSDAYCAMDLPVPGAVAFVQDFVRAGGLAVYLTGRTADRMAHGTLELLQRWGFPVLDGQSMMVLKPDAGAGDAAWKLGVLDRLERLGAMVATFENEPAHANAFHHRFQGAVSVLLDTTHSPDAPEPDPGLTILRDFVRS